MICLVTKHTRAGSQGKRIQCPICGTDHKVFDFNWDFMRCRRCGEPTQKKMWKYEEPRPIKQDHKSHLKDAR